MWDRIPVELWLSIATVGIWLGTAFGVYFKAHEGIYGAAVGATVAVWFFGKNYSISKFFDG